MDPQSSRVERQEFIFSQAEVSGKELVWADLFPPPAPPAPRREVGERAEFKVARSLHLHCKGGLGVDFSQCLVTYYIGAQGDEHIVCNSVHALFAVKRSGFATYHWVTSQRA